MKKILFVAVPLTVLTIVVFQAMVSNTSTQNFASLVYRPLVAQQPDWDDPDEADDMSGATVVTPEPPPADLKSAPNQKPTTDDSKNKRLDGLQDAD